MKRRLPLGAAAGVALVVVAGSALSACTVAPVAADVNGTTVTVSSLNTTLHTMLTQVGSACLLETENPSAAYTLQQASTSGTFPTSVAAAVLSNQVGTEVAVQYAAERGIHLTGTDLDTAKADLASRLSGEINANVQALAQQGIGSNCATGTGQALTGAELFNFLPASVVQTQVRNQAIDEKLLALGADVSPAAIRAYYDANPAVFTTDCVSAIVTSTQAAGNAALAQLQAGTPFADVAKTSSIDATSKAQGGALGCTFTEAQVLQAMGKTSITVGQPVGPVVDSSSGVYVIYEVTGRQVEPFAQARALAEKGLLEQTANVNRVTRELGRYARQLDITVNPQYGTWDSRALRITPPSGPPTRFLLQPALAGRSASSGLLPGSTSGSSSSSSSSSSGAPSSGGATATTTPG